MQENINQYEYKLINLYKDGGSFEHPTDNINKLGKEGWEAISTINGGGCGDILLKRPIGVITMELPEIKVRNTDEYNY